MLLITPLERQALQLLSQERGLREIAESLGISALEVGPYLTALFAKMGATCRSEAVSAGWRRGLLTSDDELDQRVAATASVGHLPDEARGYGRTVRDADG